MADHCYSPEGVDRLVRKTGRYSAVVTAVALSAGGAIVFANRGVESWPASLGVVVFLGLLYLLVVRRSRKRVAGLVRSTEIQTGPEGLSCKNSIAHVTLRY